MRDDLRRSCREIWVLDCSPEGHQPHVPTRIFQGVQQPVCIVLAARTLMPAEASPARVRFRALPEGPREDKFAALSKLSLSDTDWTDCPTGWRDPFLPASTGAWRDFTALDDLFVYNGSGVMPGRTCWRRSSSSRRTVWPLWRSRSISALDRQTIILGD